MILKKILKKIYKKTNRSYALNLNNFNTKIELDFIEEKKFDEGMFDLIYNKQLSKSNIKITRRTIDNGDEFIYFQIDNPSPITINIDIPLYDNEIYFDHMYIEPEYDNRYGKNKVSGPYAYIESNQQSMIISKVYYYNWKIKKYSNGQSSRVIELFKEKADIKLSGCNILINIDDYEGHCSFFILKAKGKLFNNKDNLEKYFSFYFDGVKNNAVNNSFFVLPSGTQTKLPYSIEPFIKDGYGFSLHHSSKKELIVFARETKERYFYDFLVNSIMQTYLYQPHNNYVFYTQFTSTWLKKDTGITAPYIDSRLNETFYLMQNDLLQIYPNLSVKGSQDSYIDFLMDYYINGYRVYKEKDGFIFPDYFKEDNTSGLAHASLNHQLGSLIFIREKWKRSGDLSYKKIYEKMIKYIEYTSYRWINKSNNDLYYSVKFNENNELVFKGKDYVYVTFIDLLIAQTNYIEDYNVKLDALDSLIKSKLDYLNKNGYSIFSENTKTVPGELGHREYARKLYEKLYS